MPVDCPLPDLRDISKSNATMNAVCGACRLMCGGISKCQANVLVTRVFPKVNCHVCQPKLFIPGRLYTLAVYHIVTLYR